MVGDHVAEAAKRSQHLGHDHPDHDEPGANPQSCNDRRQRQRKHDQRIRRQSCRADGAREGDIAAIDRAHAVNRRERNGKEAGKHTEHDLRQGTNSQPCHQQRIKNDQRDGKNRGQDRRCCRRHEIRASDDEAEQDAQRPGDDDRHADFGHGNQERAQEHGAVGLRRQENIARSRENDGAHQPRPNDQFPRGQRRGSDQQRPDVARLHFCGSEIRCQMRLRMRPKLSLPMISRSRGRGKSIVSVPMMLPGRALITRTVSER